MSKVKELRKIPIDDVLPNPYQKRKDMDTFELSNSIAESGLLEPIVVTDEVGDKPVLIAGHRRLKAAKEAHLEEIDAIVRDTKENKLALENLLENYQNKKLALCEMEDAVYEAKELEGSLRKLAQKIGASYGTLFDIIEGREFRKKLEKRGVRLPDSTTAYDLSRTRGLDDVTRLRVLESKDSGDVSAVHLTPLVRALKEDDEARLQFLDNPTPELILQLVKAGQSLLGVKKQNLPAKVANVPETKVNPNQQLIDSIQKVYNIVQMMSKSTILSLLPEGQRRFAVYHLSMIVSMIQKMIAGEVIQDE